MGRSPTYTEWKRQLLTDCVKQDKVDAFKGLGETILRIIYDNGTQPTVAAIVRDGLSGAGSYTARPSNNRICFPFSCCPPFFRRMVRRCAIFLSLSLRREPRRCRVTQSRSWKARFRFSRVGIRPSFLVTLERRG